MGLTTKFTPQQIINVFVHRQMVNEFIRLLRPVSILRKFN